jgi:hypothetical protein
VSILQHDSEFLETDIMKAVPGLPHTVIAALADEY